MQRTDPVVMQQPTHLLDLPPECIGTVLVFLDLHSVLAFVASGLAAKDAAEQLDEVWRGLHRARAWASPAMASELARGAPSWRAAYVQAARASSPLVLQLSSFRCLCGFAKDASPRATAGVGSGEGAVGAAIDAAIRELGLPSIEGAEVCLVYSPLDTHRVVEDSLSLLFERGARCVRLADGACAAMRHAGCETGALLWMGAEESYAACVIDGKMLPLRPTHCDARGLRGVVERFVELTNLPERAPADLPGEASASVTETLVDAALDCLAHPARAGEVPAPAAAGVAWLLRHHCYVRAVSISRRPVGADEASMARCTLRPPSCGRWVVGTERFEATETLFHASPTAPCPRPGGGEGACARQPDSPGSAGARPGGAVCLVRDAVESAPRAHLLELYGHVVLGGVCGSLRGLRQRIEHEMRIVRGEAQMPRGLRPKLVDAPGGDGDGGDSDGDGCCQWALSSAEVSAWKGAASCCLADVRLADARVTAEQFVDSHWYASGMYHVQRAMRAAGTPRIRDERRDRGLGDAAVGCETEAAHQGQGDVSVPVREALRRTKLGRS